MLASTDVSAMGCNTSGLDIGVSLGIIRYPRYWYQRGKTNLLAFCVHEPNLSQDLNNYEPPLGGTFLKLWYHY